MRKIHSINHLIFFKVFNSPLAAGSLIKLYFNLKNACFNDEMSYTARNVASATIRLHKPHCDIPEEFSGGNLVEDVSELLMELQGLVNRKVEGEESITTFEGPTFCFVFEFLKKALLSSAITPEEIPFGIELISMHAQLKGRSVDGSDLGDYNHPKYLPTLQMMKLLVDLMQRYPGRIQTQAVAAFLDVAVSLSGHEYRAVASNEEIEYLLDILQDSSVVIRDIGVRGMLAIVNVLPAIGDDYDLAVLIIRR